MAGLVSICIPTYKRPALAREAVLSALAQTYAPVEVLVSDDSPDERTREALADLIDAGRVRYVRHEPSLRQARNVNHLFDMATGEFVVLLHDDDLLLPDAVASLMACFERDPSLSAAFGKQYLIDRTGNVDETRSESLSTSYHRSKQHAGRQPSAMWSALVVQFPNDGYMVRASLAKQTRYRDDASVGDACDFDFGLRLAQAGGGFHFLDQYTCKYRLTGQQVSAGNNYTNLTFDLIDQLKLPVDLEAERLNQLRRFARPAVNRWLTLGSRRDAWRVYTHRAYGWKNRLGPAGAVHLVLILLPAPLRRIVIQRLRKS